MDGNLAMNSHFENMSEKDMNDMHDHFMKQDLLIDGLHPIEWVEKESERIVNAVSWPASQKVMYAGAYVRGARELYIKLFGKY